MSSAMYSRAPSQPGTEAEHPNPRGASGTQSTGAPQGGHVPGPDPGLAHPHLVTRPMYYIHTPPPPPFLHYQWPMPFYNPFNPFSGMGYGMMMPPFPPATYMEPPTYFVPHAPVQPMDYRRMVHPQPHPNNAAYLNQTRRPRPPNPSMVRETVNSGVQTEPADQEFPGGSPLRSCSDSGRGTAPNSPTTSTSSNQKNSNEDGENCIQAKEGLELRIACTGSEIKPELQMQKSGGKMFIQNVGKEKYLVSSPSSKSHNLHLVRQENMETQDTPKSSKERRVSVPDILLRWGNGTAQEEGMTADKSVKLPSYEEEVANFQSSTVVNEELLDVETVNGDQEEIKQIADPKSCFEPFEHSLNISIKLCSAGHDTVNEPTLEEHSDNAQTASGKLKRKLNESIWSVESLPVFIPTKEWLAQNTTVGPEVIMEMVEEAEKGAPTDETGNPKSRHNFSTESVNISDSFISFSTPASKVTAKQADNVTNTPMIHKLQKCMNPPSSPICDNSKLVDTVKDADGNEAPEPVDTSKQLSITEEEKIRGDSCKTVLLEADKVSGEEFSQKKGSEGRVEQLSIPPPIHAVTEVSPSKMDCGVQVPEPQTNGSNAGMNGKQFNTSAADVQNTSSRSEGFHGYGQRKRNFHYRNKGQDRHHSQQEAFYHCLDRPVKPRGEA